MPKVKENLNSYVERAYRVLVPGSSAALRYPHKIITPKRKGILWGFRQKRRKGKERKQEREEGREGGGKERRKGGREEGRNLNYLKEVGEDSEIVAFASKLI